MTSFASLLVATELSVSANNAVRRAALIAQEHGARLHILHVLNRTLGSQLRHWPSTKFNLETEAAHALGVLRGMAAEIAGICDVTPTVSVLAGDSVEILTRAAELSDLVVLEQRRRGRNGVPWIGSAVAPMIRACPRPILVIKTPAERPYRRVLVPVDLKVRSDAALLVAASMKREAGVHVLQAIDGRREAALREANVSEHTLQVERLREEAGSRARLNRKIASLGLDTTRMSLVLAQGPALHSTLQHARQIDADLIVAGQHGRSFIADLLFESFNGGLLSQAACDVLLVPEPRPGPRPHAEVTHAQWIHYSPRFMPRRPS